MIEWIEKVAVALHHFIADLALIAAVFFLIRAWYLRKGRRDQEHISLLEERIRNDDARLRERGEKIRKLEELVAAIESRVAEVVLDRHLAELQQGNYERAYLAIEDWFETERRHIGEATKRLAEHYASYGEPELARDAMAKSRRAASVAIACLDEAKEIVDLVDEIAVVSAEFASGSEELEQIGHALDIVHDFAGPPSISEALQRVIAAISTADHQLDEGRYRLATLFADRAVRVARRALPVDHELRLSALLKFAQCLHLNGRDIDAEKVLREIIVIQLRTFGEEHPQTLLGQSLLAQVLGSRASSEEAESILRKIIPSFLRIEGAEGDTTLANRGFLARILVRRRKFAEAELILREIIPIIDRVQGAESLNTLASRYLLATVHNEFGRFAEAETILQEIIPIQRRLAGDEHPHHTLAAQALHAVVLHALGRFTEAERQIRDVIPILERRLGHENPETLTCRNPSRCLPHAQRAVMRQP